MGANKTPGRKFSYIFFPRSMRLMSIPNQHMMRQYRAYAIAATTTEKLPCKETGEADNLQDNGTNPGFQQRETKLMTGPSEHRKGTGAGICRPGEDSSFPDIEDATNSEFRTFHPEASGSRVMIIGGCNCDHWSIKW